MTLEVHHVCAIERPKLDRLIVADRSEAVELGDFAEATHDIIVGQYLLLQDPLEPESDLFVLAARDGDAVGKLEDGHGV